MLFAFYSFSQLSKESMGKALKFDGVDDYGTLPNVLGENFTLEICIKTSKESAKGLYAFQGSGIFDADVPNMHNDFTLSLLNDRVAFHDGSSNKNIVGKTKVTDGKWHQISLTRTKGEFFRLYIDGKFEGQSKAGKQVLNKKPIIHVATNRSYMTFTKLLVDEIRFWNRVLQPNEIRNNMFMELPENQKDLIAYYPISKEQFTESDKIIDASGNKNHGQLVNSDQNQKSRGAIPVGKKAWTYPIYKSPVFIGILGLVLILLIILGVRIRLSFLKRENEKLEKLVHARTKALEVSLSDKDKLLHEKDILLQEVHHRIKNNLQQISTLLEMQIQNVFEEAGISALKDAHRRISSMSLIHEMLYTVDNVSLINTSDFIEDLISKHIQSFNYLGKNVQFTIQIENHHIKPNDAISIGMLLSETISNSYKHAFSGISDPTITVVLKQIDEDLFVLKVCDNGIGFKDEKDFDTHKSFGMRLIGIFAKKLNGKLAFDISSGGVCVEVEFTIN
jgi:two-component sensor histidine kinase